MVFYDSRLVLYSFSWFQVGFTWSEEGCIAFMVPGRLFMVPGGFSQFQVCFRLVFHGPKWDLWLFMVPVGFFRGSRWVFHGSRSISNVFHGPKWVVVGDTLVF